MAGFSIVILTLLMFMIIMGVLFIGSEICAVLGIVFSVLTITSSNKYLRLGGNYPFQNVRRFHIASFVFFIINCVAVGLCLFFLLFAFSEDIDGSGAAIELYQIILILSLFCGSNIACIILKAVSFKKYRMAQELSERLEETQIKSYAAYSQNAAVQYGYSAQKQYAGNNASKGETENVYCPKCGGENRKGSRFCRFCGERMV